MTLPVYVAPEALADACAVAQVALAKDLPVGAAVQLTGAVAHHAGTVRRTRPGENIELVDGAGTRVQVRVTAVGKKELAAAVIGTQLDPPSKPKITLVQALAKSGRDEQAIETATEYGVAEVVPWRSDRTIVNWAGKEAKARTKWENTALSAVQQSRRSYGVTIAELLDSQQLSSWIRAKVADGAQVFICHETAQTDLLAALQTGTAQGVAEEVIVVVGPEGGITETEVAEFSGAGARPVLLGEHIMRAATAGPWAIAVISAYAKTQVPNPQRQID
ncbi:MAG: 16S rRNA (uracil(1498)-N(3))-methyltransferase [Trueperella sp.]|nr:16S rRNA (uracil(1498)-N(3))-methyltransferase [Trueperella sp.]